MANLVLYMKCGNWVHGRCANSKRFTTRLATCFFFLRFRRMMEGMVN